MFGHRPKVYCYIDKSGPTHKVYASPDKLDKHNHIEKILQIKCCCFSAWYNTITEEFAIHHNNEDGWLELPWSDWVDVANPDHTKTFTFVAAAYHNRLMGIKQD